MVTMVLGANANDFSVLETTYEIIDTLRHDPTIAPGSTTATATWEQTTQDQNGQPLDYNAIVTFHGTGLNTLSGNITGIDFSVEQGGVTYQEVTATGFNISSADMLAAITAYTNGNRAPLKAVFEGVGWTLDATSLSSDQSVYFQGTGGDDTVKLGATQDELGLDGGSDTIQLGGGNDKINFYCALGYAGEGHSTVDAGSGADELVLDYGLKNNIDQYVLLTGGMTVNLNKAVDFGNFNVTFKNVETVWGTRYSDSITGTNAKETLIGYGGGDTLTGGGGADNLMSEGGVEDFFRYVKASDSKVGKGHDNIYDFEHSLDVIDLSKIDPGTKNHAFHFVGDHALKKVGDLSVEFINHAGTDKDYYLVNGNLDKDKAAEFQIEVHSLEHLNKHDFML